VEIKRIIKGSDVLLAGRRWTFNGLGPRPRVLVAGIGDRAICNSAARKYDTRIFLVSRNAGSGQLRLNSSLVRISLNNIERTEAAVNGNLYALAYFLIYLITSSGYRLYRYSDTLCFYSVSYSVSYLLSLTTVSAVL